MSSRYVRVWKVVEPPADFADRVAATALVDQKRRFTRRAAFGLAAAACTALAAWKYDRSMHRRGGDLTANVRTEIELAPGAIAILERGARLVWDAAGAWQVGGDVSYRLLPDAALKVETALGTLRAVGSWCRVKMASGAGQASAVFVSVTQGKIDIVAPTRRVALHGGQYARVTSRAIDTDLDDASGDIARALDLEPPHRAPDPSPATPAQSAAPPLAKRPSDRAPRSTAAASVPPQTSPADAGARAVIVPSCFCDRGDSLCACFH
jgi:hypothetical protein